MAWSKRREEFDHTSQGGAWSAESVSDGKDWRNAKEHASNRSDAEKEAKPPTRRLFGL